MTIRRARLLWTAAAFGIVMMACATPAAAQTAANQCLACHSNLPSQALSAPAKAFPGDIHQQRGFACVDCHGGDAASADPTLAHSTALGYRGKPSGTQIVAVCSRCHSDAEFMRKFSPLQRVDQAVEYASSTHGKRLAAGDLQVATCVSCHGAHDVRVVNDPRSPAFPTNVASTCAACHSSAERMKPYTLAGGGPLPTNQRTEYERSVHHTALASDMSAPTCNDCHGNHGAAPPGVSSLTTVCGTCHTVFASKFATSVHAQIFERSCIECHGNHAVLPTSDDMIGTSNGTLCSACHEGPDDPGAVGAERMRASLDGFKRALEASESLIGEARNAGMEVGDQELLLSEARTKLVLARTEIHAFDPATLDSVVIEGTKLLAGVDESGHRALGELAFRRRGLFLSMGAILLMAIALWLKIKDLEQRRHTQGD